MAVDAGVVVVDRRVISIPVLFSAACLACLAAWPCDWPACAQLPALSGPVSPVGPVAHPPLPLCGRSTEPPARHSTARMRLMSAQASGAQCQAEPAKQGPQRLGLGTEPVVAAYLMPTRLPHFSDELPAQTTNHEAAPDAASLATSSISPMHASTHNCTAHQLPRLYHD